MAKVTATTALEPVSFSDLLGWPEDDHQAAFQAFTSSAPAVLASKNSTAYLRAACGSALETNATGLTSANVAQSFFEEYFTPHRIVCADESGLLTGYYEPELAGSLTRTPQFSFPVLARPVDLMNLVEESQRGALSDRLTHGRYVEDGSFEPYFTRQEIDEGALDGLGLEIVFVADPVDLFLMQVQGSGLIHFADGSAIRLSYAGKNGHPYSSVGRHLIETGVFTQDAMNLGALADWLKADPARARPLLWHNLSYVFFRVLGTEQQTHTLGTDSIPLTPLRSLAVDTGFHDLGLPVYLTAPALDHTTEGQSGFRRLMVAHDVGSAIKGPERGDLFYGSGSVAGVKAGMTNHAVKFFPLLPKRAAESE